MGWEDWMMVTIAGWTEMRNDFGLHGAAAFC